MTAPSSNCRFFACTVAVLIALVTILTSPQIATAQMKTMNNDQLSDVYAEGFASFTITSAGGIDSAKATFNILTYSYIEIESLKLGYHAEYDYKDPIPSSKSWDEDWTTVQIGGDINNPDEDFQTEGAYFKADFTNIDDPTTRELKGITFGATKVTGDISATFNSFSGTIDDSNNSTPEYNGHALNLGTKTITATDSSFSISLSIDGYDKGYWVTFNNAYVH